MSKHNEELNNELQIFIGQVEAFTKRIDAIIEEMGTNEDVNVAKVKTKLEIEVFCSVVLKAFADEVIAYGLRTLKDGIVEVGLKDQD